MPYVSVDVDIEDVIDHLSDEDLRKELAKRMARKADYRHSMGDYSIPIGEAKAALEEVSLYFRRIGKIDLAFKMDEISEDYVGIVAKPRIKYKGSLVAPLNHQVPSRESGVRE
jgi:hypothetical protein